jgi:hypothetical protein
MRLLALLVSVAAAIWSANELNTESQRVTEVIELATAGDVNGLRALD